MEDRSKAAQVEALRTCRQTQVSVFRNTFHSMSRSILAVSRGTDYRIIVHHSHRWLPEGNRSTFTHFHAGYGTRTGGDARRLVLAWCRTQDEDDWCHPDFRATLEWEATCVGDTDDCCAADSSRFPIRVRLDPGTNENLANYGLRDLNAT